MSILSLQFFIFAALVVLLYYILPKKIQWVVLLVASIAFYLTYGWEKLPFLLVPAGCAHGYLVLEDSIVSYKCGEKFYGEYDDGILWDDADIGVEWPLELVGGREKVILAEKDRNLQSFSQFMDTYGGF